MKKRDDEQKRQVYIEYARASFHRSIGTNQVASILQKLICKSSDNKSYVAIANLSNLADINEVLSEEKHRLSSSRFPT